MLKNFLKVRTIPIDTSLSDSVGLPEGSISKILKSHFPFEPIILSCEGK